MSDVVERLGDLPDADLTAMHERIDTHGPADSAIIEAHHFVTMEMARRGIDHGHTIDSWAQAALVMDEVQVDGPDEIEAPEGLEKAFAASLSEGGTVQVLLTVDGYVMKAEPSVSDVHVDTIMPGRRRRGVEKAEWKAGQFASWGSSGGPSQGVVERVVAEGSLPIPDSTFTIRAEEDDPAVLLRVYRKGPKGWMATDRLVGHKASTLTRIDALTKADGETVPRDVQAAARQALRWIEDGRAGDGFTAVGRARARQLADGGTVSRDVLVKMRAYFARHAVDKDAEGWGDRSDPTPGMVAWYAWGGDAGRAWANRMLGDVEKRAIPAAITDLHLNVENRQHAIDEYVYGPMNPDMPGDYWQRLGDVWGVSAEEAATTRCHNCAAFNMTSEIQSAIADGIGDGGEAVVEAAELGYCELLSFKCAADRSCSVWLTGGPISDDSGEDDGEEEFLASLTAMDKQWYAQVGVILESGGDPDLVMEKAGNPEALRDYWRGGGKGKISWGAGGDFTSCVAAVGKYMTSEQAKGYCAIRHREVTGMWPGDKRNRPAKKARDIEPTSHQPQVNVVYNFVPGDGGQWAPVVKHPGHADQKVHAGRSTTVSDDVAASIIERVRRDEGLSVDMLDGSEPPSGYMVARGSTGGVKPKVVTADEFYDPERGPAVLSSFLKDNRSTLTRGDYLGLWHDKESGKVFLDVSQNVPDRAKAEALGRRRDQISIWDVVNGKEIPTGGTGQVSKESDSGSEDAGHIEDDGRGDRRLRGGSLEEVRGQEVTKHGKHDQSTHGRKGGRAATERGEAKGEEASTWTQGMPVPALVPDAAPGTVKGGDGKVMSRTPEASAEAVALRERSVALEPATTAMVTRMAAEHGGEMSGLENRLKTSDSLARKIDADAVKEHGGDRASAAASVSDSLRYTTVFDNDNYTAGTRATLDALEADGYSIRAKNFWQEGDPYQGMNVKATKDGVTVELQFHTRDSVRIKGTTLHPLYEEYRKSTDDTKRRSLWDKMVDTAGTIPRPAGYTALLGIGTLTMQTFETAQQAGLMG